MTPDASNPPSPRTGHFPCPDSFSNSKPMSGLDPKKDLAYHISGSTVDNILAPFFVPQISRRIRLHISYYIGGSECSHVHVRCPTADLSR
jgi:hypothetical protein